MMLSRVAPATVDDLSRPAAVIPEGGEGVGEGVEEVEDEGDGGRSLSSLDPRLERRPRFLLPLLLFSLPSSPPSLPASSLLAAVRALDLPLMLTLPPSRLPYPSMSLSWLWIRRLVLCPPSAWRPAG